MSNALPAGHVLQEYRVEKLLGVGGFGLTYLATDQNLDLKVALKEYLPGDVAVRGEGQSIVPKSAEDTESFGWGKRRFLDESRTLASFRHPNIVRVMRFFEANGSAYMVMEFVEGAPLTDWIAARRPLAEAQVAALVRPLLEGLEVVHRAGFMHRDIKPANIYMREDGSPVLLDFGSARQKSAELTAVVSPGYAPFEQYHTQGKQGPWSDLYALGGVLYWIVTGNRPHEAAARIRQDTMPPAVQAGDRSRYRNEFLAAIDWALAPNEDERPQSVGEWRNALLGGAAPEPKTEKLPPKKAVQPPSLPPEVLSRAEQRLAEYIGPVARIVVQRAALKARDEAELYLLLADEIEDKAEKKAFIRKAVSISGKP